MGDRSSFPWPAAGLALAAGIVMIVSGAGVALAFAVTLLWIGTLWMVGSPAPPPSAGVEQEAMSAERMGELFEFSDSPIIVTRRNRVAVANRAARKLLEMATSTAATALGLEHCCGSLAAGKQATAIGLEPPPGSPLTLTSLLTSARPAGVLRRGHWHPA